MPEQTEYEGDREKYARIAGGTLLDLIMSNSTPWTEAERDFARILIKAHAFAECEMLDGSFLGGDIFESPDDAPGDLGPFLATRQEAFASYVTGEGAMVWVTARRNLFACLRSQGERISLTEEQRNQISQALTAAYGMVSMANLS